MSLFTLVLLGIILAIVISYSIILLEKTIHLIIKNNLFNAEDFWQRIFICAVVVVFVNTAFSLFNLPDISNAKPPFTFNPNSSPVHAYCFDFTGRPRCPLLIPLPPGTPCYCPYQGTGYTGYL